MSTDGPPILRPIPRRPFDLNFTSSTPESSSPSSPSPEHSSSNHLEVKSNGAETPSTFSRTRSIMNLTQSTLFGIYAPSGDNDREELTTPWGTGALTPRDGGNSIPGQTERPVIRRKVSQHVSHTPLPNYLLNIALRTILLFCFGMGYGLLVTHLHDDQKLAPFHVEGIIKPSYNWRYLVFWGVAGVGLGSLLPWVDTMWEDNPKIVHAQERSSAIENEEAVTTDSSLSADWHPLVRSIGAFVGIAFAIRKLPWASTLQVSLTLALVNPVLWYIIDRSRTGFMLSAAIGVFGTSILLTLNPEMMPTPATTFSLSPRNLTRLVPSEALGGLVSHETIEAGTWIASVLFCSCVCFGNIGRRLSLNRGKTVRRDSFR